MRTEHEIIISEKLIIRTETIVTAKYEYSTIGKQQTLSRSPTVRGTHFSVGRAACSKSHCNFRDFIVDQTHNVTNNS